MNASTQVSTFLNCRLPLALLFFETILPRLFLIKESLVRPPTVFSLVPLKTCDFARRPRAILLTFFFFMTFLMAFFMATLATIGEFAPSAAMASGDEDTDAVEVWYQCNSW